MTSLKKRFIRATKTHEFQKCLQKDPCYLYTDRYLLAMTAVYCHRAKLQGPEFTAENLFALLHLANDMEEDFEYHVRNYSTKK